MPGIVPHETIATSRAAIPADFILRLKNKIVTVTFEECITESGNARSDNQIHIAQNKVNVSLFSLSVSSESASTPMRIYVSCL